MKKVIHIEKWKMWKVKQRKRRGRTMLYSSDFLGDRPQYGKKKKEKQEGSLWKCG